MLNEGMPESPIRDTSVPVQPESSRQPEGVPPQLEHMAIWKKTTIRVPFLEDTDHKIIVRNIKELDPVRVYGAKPKESESDEA
ncbi:hypothetical protein L6452_31084 [Arctium lappa]|uniref:Uncharacterized protein n=1 Tax=Arctium lappa TaxID=4217 RepID=A0ACB8ZK96_ARCLA|nr:hypothetical protein L6452_31084 [Arctium lappa]